MQIEQAEDGSTEEAAIRSIMDEYQLDRPFAEAIYLCQSMDFAACQDLVRQPNVPPLQRMAAASILAMDNQAQANPPQAQATPPQAPQTNFVFSAGGDPQALPQRQTLYRPLSHNFAHQAPLTAPVPRSQAPPLPATRPSQADQADQAPQAPAPAHSALAMRLADALAIAKSMRKFGGNGGGAKQDHPSAFLRLFAATFSGLDPRAFPAVLQTLLEGEAKDWLEGLITGNERDLGQPLFTSMDDFVQAFSCKYITDQVRFRPFEARQALAEGKVFQKGPLEQYYRHFQVIARQAEDLSERDKIFWFIRGMHPDIQLECAATPDGKAWDSLQALLKYAYGAEGRLRSVKSSARHIYPMAASAVTPAPRLKAHTDVRFRRLQNPSKPGPRHQSGGGSGPGGPGPFMMKRQRPQAPAGFRRPPPRPQAPLAPLSTEEKARRRRDGLCFHCAFSRGHASWCPKAADQAGGSGSA